MPGGGFFSAPPLPQRAPAYGGMQMPLPLPEERDSGDRAVLLALLQLMNQKEQSALDRELANKRINMEQSVLTRQEHMEQIARINVLAQNAVPRYEQRLSGLRRDHERSVQSQRTRGTKAAKDFIREIRRFTDRRERMTLEEENQAAALASGFYDRVKSNLSRLDNLESQQAYIEALVPHLDTLEGVLPSENALRDFDQNAKKLIELNGLVSSQLAKGRQAFEDQFYDTQNELVNRIVGGFQELTLGKSPVLGVGDVQKQVEEFLQERSGVLREYGSMPGLTEIPDFEDITRERVLNPLEKAGTSLGSGFRDFTEFLGFPPPGQGGTVTGPGLNLGPFKYLGTPTEEQLGVGVPPESLDFIPAPVNPNYSTMLGGSQPAVPPGTLMPDVSPPDMFMDSLFGSFNTRVEGPNYRIPSDARYRTNLDGPPVPVDQLPHYVPQEDRELQAMLLNGWVPLGGVP